MTKLMHVINGDSSRHEVIVTVQELRDGEWVNTTQLYLSNPGEITSKYIWGKQRLVISEMEE